MPHTRRSSAATAGAGLLALAIVALPLWRGGVDWGAQAAAAVALPLALLLSARTEGRLPLAALPLLAVLGVMALQLLPLPARLHGLSPAARGIFETALGPLDLYPAARPLSLDPPATAREFAKAAAGLCAFAAAWAAGMGRRRRELVLGALAASGLAVAGLVLAGGLVGAVPLLAPRFPFVNPNHLAGLANLTAFPLLGLALRSRGQARLLWLLGCAATSALAFTSLSRGGAAAFVLGAGVFGALALRRRDGSGAPLRPGLAALAIGTSVALAAVAALVVEPMRAELAAHRGLDSEPKTALLAPALVMAREHPLLGVGRGAFESAFTAYKTSAEQVTFTHLENEWVQPLVELGWPAGLLLVITLGLTWLAAARRRDLSWTEVGLLAGLAGLTLQNAFDFSLELLGVSVPFMAALGLAARGAGPVPVRRWVVPSAAGLLLAAALAGLAFARARPPEASSLEIARAPDRSAMLAAARRAVSWRPADYVPQATAGRLLVEDGRCAEALPWLLRAMFLNPTAPEPHLDAARCLAASDQRTLALREFRLAWSYGGSTALSEAAAWYPDIDSLLQVAPATPDGLIRLGEALSSSRPADAAVAFRRALEEFAEEGALIPLARAHLAAGDLQAAREVAERRLARAPRDDQAWRVLADARLKAGDEAGAVDAAQRGLAEVPGSAPLHAFLYDRAMAGRRFSEARRLAEEITAHAPAEVSAKLLLVARALAAQGRLGEAIEVARSAAAAQPDRPGPLLEQARLCELAGRLDEAIAALERAAALPGQVPEAYAERLRALAAAKAALDERRLQQGLQR